MDEINILLGYITGSIWGETDSPVQCVAQQIKGPACLTSVGFLALAKSANPRIAQPNPRIAQYCRMLSSPRLLPASAGAKG